MATEKTNSTNTTTTTEKKKQQPTLALNQIKYEKQKIATKTFLSKTLH